MVRGVCTLISGFSRPPLDHTVLSVFGVNRAVTWDGFDQTCSRKRAKWSDLALVVRISREKLGFRHSGVPLFPDGP